MTKQKKPKKTDGKGSRPKGQAPKMAKKGTTVPKKSLK